MEMSEKLQKLFELKEEQPTFYRADYLWQSLEARATYGGHLVSMAISACNRTITKGLNLHSLHSCFIRGGNKNSSAYLKIAKTRDGQSFSSRSVTISQGEKPIFTMLASYHKEAKEASHALNVKCDMPTVRHHSQINALPTNINNPNPDISYAVFHRPGYIQSFLRDFPVELKPLDPVKFISRSTRPTNILQCWLRLKIDIGDDQNHHRALLAFFSDITTGYCSISNRPLADITLGTSLDHSIWFHCNVNMSEWIFYETTCTNMNFGRGLVTGRMWNEDGELLATILQESLFRVKL